MHNHNLLDDAQIAALVIDSLHDVLSQADKPYPDGVGGDTYLIGRRSVVDSIGLVTLIIDLEQKLEEEHRISLTIADDRAMSQKNSPFLSVRSLTDYICMLIEEERLNGRA